MKGRRANALSTGVAVDIAGECDKSNEQQKGKGRRGESFAGGSFDDVRQGSEDCYLTVLRMYRSGAYYNKPQFEYRKPPSALGARLRR